MNIYRKKYAQKYLIGSVHGRFQPLHNGHLKYILEAKKYCDFLWIGITQYNINNLFESPQDLHRQDNFHNPFSYFERSEMITEALVDCGISLNKFDIIPFPIEKPDTLMNFLPISIPIFTTIYDKWNEYKIKILKEQGYKVEVLWKENTKAIDGITIRNKIFCGDETWKEEVPRAVIDIIEKYHIKDRLISLKENVKFSSNGS